MGSRTGLASVFRRRSGIALQFAFLAVPTGRPAIEVLGFHLVESTKDRRSLEIEANKARVYKPENLMSLDIVRTLVWGDSPKPFEVKGDYAVVNSETQDLEIPSQARVTSPDGLVFRTAELVYRADARTISSENPVEATPARSREEGDIRLTGRGLQINLNGETYEIRRSVRTQQRITKSKTMTILSSNLVIQPKENTAIFRRNIKVESPDLDVRGERLIVAFDRRGEDGPLMARRLEISDPGRRDDNGRIQANLKNLELSSKGLVINLRPGDGAVEKAEAIGQAEATTEDGIKMSAEKLTSTYKGDDQIIRLAGGVKILTGTRQGLCEEAIVYPASGDIVLERVASVTNDKQIIKGEKIRFSTKHSDITVEKVEGSMDKKDISK